MHLTLTPPDQSHAHLHLCQCKASRSYIEHRPRALMFTQSVCPELSTMAFTNLHESMEPAQLHQPVLSTHAAVQAVCAFPSAPAAVQAVRAPCSVCKDCPRTGSCAAGRAPAKVPAPQGLPPCGSSRENIFGPAL